MIRGTTPTFQLVLDDDDLDLTQVDHVYATFKQGSYCTTKSDGDLTIAARQVDVYFDQEQSLCFDDGIVYAQLNWTFNNGERACSNIVKINVGKNLVGYVLE